MTERTKRKEREEERKIIRNRTTTRRFPVQFFRYSSFSFPESRLRRCADYSREGRTNGRSLRTTSRFIRFSDFIPREDCVRFVTLFCRFRRWMVSTKASGNGGKIFWTVEYSRRRRSDGGLARGKVKAGK